jgi:hypothetical protein
MTPAAGANVTPCFECGRENHPGNRYCFCGHDLVVPAPPPPKGVGGWLLYFCFGVILLAPAVVGFRIFQNLRTLQVREGGLTQASVLVATDAAARVAILILGMVAGSLLLFRRRGAVQFARGYLVAGTLGYCGLVALPYLFPLSVVDRDRFVAHYIGRALLVLPGTAVWLLYFKYSKRVRATYPSGHSLEEVDSERMNC